MTMPDLSPAQTAGTWTTQREEEIRARLRDATPSPWHIGGTTNHARLGYIQNVWGPRADPSHQSGQEVARDVSPANAALLAHAPSDLSDALSELIRLRAENERLARDYVDACEEVQRLRSGAGTTLSEERTR